MILALDGAVPAVINDMVARGRLPNIAKLIAGGAYADDVLPAMPSKTAPGFASLWTGAPPRITGISGNRIPRTPSQQYTILETSLGFSGATLRAEPLWNTATRAGLQVIALNAPLGGEKTFGGLHVQGYNRSFFHDGVISPRNGLPKPAAEWKNPPPSNLPPLEITFTIQASTYYGLIIDDPQDPKPGYDTLLLANERDTQQVRAKLKSDLAEKRGTSLWSGMVEVKTTDLPATTYFRLFDLKSDASDYLLYFTSPARDNTTIPEVAKELKAAAGAFVGNGASLLYGQGVLGKTLARGGDGSAEARYLETVEFVHQHVLKTARWALQSKPWDLFIAYSPYPDEAEHVWRGFLDPALREYRPEVAGRLKPMLETAYERADELLGELLAHRPANTIVTLVSDHGMAGIERWVAINRALQQSGLQKLDSQGRVDLQKTLAYYPSISNNYLLINTTAHKDGIVTPAQRPEVVRKIQQALLALRDGDRPVIAALADAQVVGANWGIGGDSGGDIYIELTPGYDFDSTISLGALISQRDPIGNHGFTPMRLSMRTVMIFNGPGVAPGRKIAGATLIDFAPTLMRLMGIAPPAQAIGKILENTLAR